MASERGRSSLDIPRRPSPWNASNEGQNNRLPLPAKPLERLQPQNTEGGFLGRQRPVSMGPWSPPRTPPAVTLQSPVSPPKPIFPSNPAPLRQKLDLAQNIAPSSSNPPKVPPPRSPRPVSRKRNQDPPEFSLEKDEKANLKLVTAGVKKPPPINRAAKPATPTTAVAWTPLDPVIPAPTQEASPFSTPPSSDGDLDHEGRKLSQAPGAARIPASASSRGYFPPPSHPAVENARRSVLANLDSSKRLAPNQLAARTTPDISDRPERRPHLPDRRNIEPSPSELNRALTTRPESRTSERRTPSLPPPRPSEASKMPPRSITDFLPPPKRNMISGTSPATSSTNRTAQLATTPAMARTSSDYGSTPFSAPPQVRRVDTNDFDGFSSDSSTIATAEFPDASRTNRRPPQSKCGVHHIYTQYDTRLFDLCGSHVCTGGYVTRAWDTNNGRMTLDLGSEEREIKVTAMTFKPGATADGEGLFLWLGNNVGEISELDLESQMIVLTKSNAHSRREILKMYRYQNSIWSLDEDGKLHVWPPDKTGVPSLSLIPQSFRVSKGHTFSLVVKDKLWLAAGKDIRVYNPMGGESHFFVTTQALRQENAGEISSGAVISNQLNKVYFGHTCGKVSIYSTTDYSCLGLLNVSAYKISTLAGAGPYLWAGFSTGMIYVYDTRSNPWVVKKDWLAHQNPVAGLLVDRSSVWKFGHLQVASIGLDNTIRFWDGMLEDDWIGTLAPYLLLQGVTNGC